MSLALVDPDNRRPVNYEAHARLLDELSELSTEDASGRMTTALSSPYSSDAKLFVTSRLLQLRRELGDLFAAGDYQPLQTDGPFKEHVLAYARSHGGKTVVVVLAKWMAQLMKGERRLPVGDVWQDTSIARPAHGAARWRSVFTAEEATWDGESMRAADVLRQMPFAAFVSID